MILQNSGDPGDVQRGLYFLWQILLCRLFLSGFCPKTLFKHAKEKKQRFASCRGPLWESSLGYPGAVTSASSLGHARQPHYHRAGEGTSHSGHSGTVPPG